MDTNYQPPAHLDVSKLTIRQPSPRLNPNDNDSDPDGHPPNLLSKQLLYYCKFLKSRKVSPSIDRRFWN